MVVFALIVLFGIQNQWSPNIEWAGKAHIVEEHRSFESSKGKPLVEPSNLVLNPALDANSYATTKANIEQLRMDLNENLKQGHISFEDVKAQFTTLLVDRIIPHWYGTSWSFEGHTSVPNQGTIACGYFISTTLRDMGLKLNRYTLAQQSPIDEAKILSCGVAIMNVEQESKAKAFQDLDRLTQEGLYFIGFDEGHVGYLLKRDGQLFLIHSNYFWPGLVCMENFEDSKVFQSFSKFHLVDISHNDVLIQRWVENEPVYNKS